MTLNLDQLKDEILEYLEAEGFVIFRGFSRLADEGAFVYWDTERHPDYRQFLEAARHLGVKLIVYSWRTFSRDLADHALERLEDAELDREDRRRIERRLRELRAYDGFTSSLELSFDYEARTYLFHLEADWYVDYLELQDEIHAATPEDADEEDDEGSVGGLFSRN